MKVYCGLFAIDIDECEDSSLNKCDQLCNNTEGSYRCGCSSGFQIAADGATCTSEFLIIHTHVRYVLYAFVDSM